MRLVHEDRRERVLENRASFVEAYTVLPMIGLGFLGVPFEHQRHWDTYSSYGTDGGRIVGDVYAVYSPMARFTFFTVSSAMGVTRSAPFASTWATKPGSAMIS